MNGDGESSYEFRDEAEIFYILVGNILEEVVFIDPMFVLIAVAYDLCLS